VVASAGTGAFEDYGRTRPDKSLHLAAAIGTNLQRLILYALEFFEFQSALSAFVFIRQHNDDSPEKTTLPNRMAC